MVKNISGLSFKNYLNYVRAEYSEEILAEQVLTLTEICETCGFSSLHILANASLSDMVKHQFNTGKTSHTKI